MQNKHRKDEDSLLKKKQDERELLRKKKVNMQKGSNPTVPPLEVDEEVDTEKKKPDQQLQARTKRINREKQQILRRKLQTVRQSTQHGSSTSDITAGYEPEGEVIEATLATARKNIGKDPKKASCWKGYKAVGVKVKGGKSVPDCKKEETFKEWVKTFEDKVKGNKHVNVNPKIGPTCPKCAGLVVDEECQNCGTKCATSDVKEAKYEAGASNYGKMSIRNKRAVGYGGNAAPPEERRKAHSERMKKHNKEEVEVVTELSKRTLGNYVKDASSDAAMTSMTHGNKPLAKDAPKREKKILKRLSGIRKATDKLSKEEVEIDESEKVAQGAYKRAQELGAKRRRANPGRSGSPGKNERAGYNLSQSARSRNASAETQGGNQTGGGPKSFGYAKNKGNPVKSKRTGDTGALGHAKKRDEKQTHGKKGQPLKSPKYKMKFKDRLAHHSTQRQALKNPKNNPKHTANEETVMELNRLEKEQGKTSGGSKDKALNFVKNKIRQETGRPAGQQKKEKGAKTNGTQKYLERQKDKKAYADKAKKAGFKSTQDYTNTMARYGGESNYKAGRGLGT